MVQRILFAGALIVAVALGCHKDRPEPVSDTGTVVFLDLEGGFFGIADDHGRHWDPTNLSQAFKADGLRIRFKGIVTDLPTIHMWGRTVELTSIAQAP